MPEKEPEALCKKQSCLSYIMTDVLLCVRRSPPLRYCGQGGRAGGDAARPATPPPRSYPVLSELSSAPPPHRTGRVSMSPAAGAAHRVQEGAGQETVTGQGAGQEEETAVERLSLLLAEVTGGERGGAVLCELERELRAEQASLHRLCRSVDTVSVRRVAAWPHNKLQTKLQVYRVSHIGTEVSTQFLCFQYREH